MKVRFYCLLFVFGTIALNTVAQQQLCYKKMEGTISEVVYCVFQDSKGYIWVGTDAGVSRYNGYSFTHYTKDDGLSDNDVFQITEDHLGRIWMLTYNGEPTIYDQGRILTSQNTFFLKAIKPGSMATGFIESNDTAWYVTRLRVYKFFADKLLDELGTDTYFNNKPGFSFLGACFFNKKPCVITSTGFYSVSDKDKIDFPQNQRLSPVSIKVAVGNNIVLATLPDQLLVFDMEKKTRNIISVSGQDRIITTFYVKEEGFFWVFAEENTYRYYPEGERFVKYEETMPKSLTYVLKDSEGNSWLAAFHHGLYFLQNTGVKKINYKTVIGTSETYSVTAHNGSIYAGYVNDEVAKITGRQITFSPADRSSFRNKVYGFYRDKNGLWVAAGNKAILYSSSGAVHSFEGSVKAIASNPANDIYVASSLNVGKTGFEDLLKKNAVLKQGGSKNVYSHAVRVNALLCLNNDTVLMGAVNGLKLLVKDSLKVNPAWKHPVFNAGITRIYPLTGSNFIFSTSGKGVVMVLKDSIYIIDKKAGLSSNSCTGLFPENDSVFWVSTVAGLNRVGVRIKNKNFTTSVRAYTVADGLLSDYINDVTVYNDTVWVATDKGLCYFQKKMPRQPYPAPQLNVEDLLVNGEPQNFNQPLQLNHKQNNVSINFTGISYFSQGKITYKYRLIGGGNEDWKFTTARHVEYASLPPGDYTFVVSAANADMKWNEHHQTIRFRIAPPFWATWWFRLIVVLSLLIIAGLLFKTRLGNIKRKHILQNKALTLEKEKAEFEKENVLYEKQLIELEQQALRLQMNPHFIFNAITAIQGLYSVNDTEKAKKYLIKFSRLLRTVFETSSEPVISLKKEVELIADYIELNIIRFGYNITYEITTDPSINTEQYGITPMLIQPFVENALLHGLQKHNGTGMLNISINKTGAENIHCRIEDNGTGRTNTDTPVVESKPHGVSITKKRIDLVGKNSASAVDFLIEDLKNPDGSAAGTVVSFTTSLIKLF
ncbi:MAG: histidine kinase [Ferruginibacter sp.]|nr:histidine kinase [Ferruginibacter sp.]